VLFENLVLLHYDGFDYQYAIALDKRTGDTVWKTDRSHDYGTTDGDMKKAFSTPLVIEAAGRLQMISPCAKAVFSYDPRSGKEIWHVLYPSHSAAARPLFAEGLVFIDTGFSKADLLAIRPDGKGDVTKSNVVWKATKGIGSKPSPVIVDGLIYVVTDAGVATCLDASTGEQIWTQRLGGEFSAALVAARDRVYFCDEQGKTTVIKPGREFQELATNTLDEGGKCSPAAVGKALILRTKSALYRIEER
jgi:outer membrane protein assembly factor BamB